MIEGVDTEFKELDRVKGTLPDSIPKEIVAFANTEGGELYVGIRNDGSVIGVSDPDDVMTRISNVAHDTILPDIMPFIQIRPVEMEGKQVVKTTIAVGTERPYYLAKEGLKPKGVYVRRGSACIPPAGTLPSDAGSHRVFPWSSPSGPGRRSRRESSPRPPALRGKLRSPPSRRTWIPPPVRASEVRRARQLQRPLP